jgi:hypothetical protein
LGARFLNAENRNVELLGYKVEIELEHDALSFGQVARHGHGARALIRARFFDQAPYGVALSSNADCDPRFTNSSMTLKIMS